MLDKLLIDGHWGWFFTGVLVVPFIIVAIAFYFYVKEPPDWDIHG